MSIRKLLLLATTALIVGAGCEIMPNKSGLVPAQEEEELGPFGLPVGEPINVISATRGDGVSFDNFQVTFNNAEGTDITITTPEGETINFTEADLEWAGWDPNLGIEVARLTSSRGDRLDVTIGTNYVMRTEDAEDAEYVVDEETGELVCVAGTGCAGELMEVPVAALARMDETDTRAGFETYGVVGMETDPENLARYQEDQEGAEFILDEETGELVCVAGSGCAGDLVTGTGSYDGQFVASVSQRGENVSDTVRGHAVVDINFAGNTVDIWLNGSYNADDVDDRANAVTGVGGTGEGDAVAGIGPTGEGDAVADIGPTGEGDAVAGVGPTGEGTAITGVEAIDTIDVIGGIDSSPVDVVGSKNTDTATALVPRPTETETFVRVVNTELPIDITVVESVSATGEGTAITGVQATDSIDVIGGVEVTDTIAVIGGVEVTDTIGVIGGVEVTDTIAVIGGVEVTSTENDNSDSYVVSLYGSGSSTDLDIGFNGSVQYTGLLSGNVEVPSDNAGTNTVNVGVAGTFGGAVYGAGAAAASSPDNFFGVVEATSTAGVFQADSGHVLVPVAPDNGPVGLSADNNVELQLVPAEVDSYGVDITGGYIAAGDD